MRRQSFAIYFSPFSMERVVLKMVIIMNIDHVLGSGAGAMMKSKDDGDDDNVH